MTLRTLSIGLSAVVLLGICGFWVFFFLSDGDPFMLPVVLFIFSPFIISSVFLQIVSLVISVYSKHPFSHIIAATISLLHGLFFAITFILGVRNDMASEVWFYLPFSGILLMPALYYFGLPSVSLKDVEPKSPNGTLNCPPRLVEL